MLCCIILYLHYDFDGGYPTIEYQMLGNKCLMSSWSVPSLVFAPDTRYA